MAVLARRAEWPTPAPIVYCFGNILNLISQGLWGEGRRMGLGGRDRSAMIEWRSRLDGLNGIILLLSLMNYDLIAGPVEPLIRVRS